MEKTSSVERDSRPKSAIPDLSFGDTQIPYGTSIKKPIPCQEQGLKNTPPDHISYSPPLNVSENIKKSDDVRRSVSFKENKSDTDHGKREPKELTKKEKQKRQKEIEKQNKQREEALKKQEEAEAKKKKRMTKQPSKVKL